MVRKPEEALLEGERPALLLASGVYWLTKDQEEPRPALTLRVHRVRIDLQSGASLPKKGNLYHKYASGHN